MTEKTLKDIEVVTATVMHLKYVDQVNDEIDSASKERGTGIARRTYDYIANKMLEGKAVIALDGDQFAGFCYLESWGHNRFVANSGLIVAKAYRGVGLATEIKRKIFNLSRMKFPDAKIFGLTTGLAVMKINHELGYRPVTFSELTDDEEFWKGCTSCVNYDILQRTGRSKCLCTGMLFDPKWESKKSSNGVELISENQVAKPKRASLLDVIQKLKPKNGSNQVKESKFNILMTIMSKI